MIILPACHYQGAYNELAQLTVSSSFINIQGWAHCLQMKCLYTSMTTSVQSRRKICNILFFYRDLIRQFQSNSLTKILRSQDLRHSRATLSCLYLSLSYSLDSQVALEVLLDLFLTIELILVNIFNSSGLFFFFKLKSLFNLLLGVSYS